MQIVKAAKCVYVCFDGVPYFLIKGFYNTFNPSVICNLIVAYRTKLSIFIDMTP